MCLKYFVCVVTSLVRKQEGSKILSDKNSESKKNLQWKVAQEALK